MKEFKKCLAIIKSVKFIICWNSFLLYFYTILQTGKGQLQNQFVYSKIFTVYLLFIAVDVCLLNTCGNEIIITFGNIL